MERVLRHAYEYRWRRCLGCHGRGYERPSLGFRKRGCRGLGRKAGRHTELRVSDRFRNKTLLFLI
jgi:hypothetical protein